MVTQGTKLEKIENILTDCIQDIKSGKATLAECLDHYYSRRNELEPLIKMALNIQEPPAFTMDSSFKQAAKARLMHQIQDTRQKKTKSFTDILSLGIPPRLTWARVVVSVLVAIILMSMLAGGTAYAAQDSLPGDFLYLVKEKTEDARLLIAGDESAKARLSLAFAQTRLNEMNELINVDPERAGLAIDGYNDDLDAAFKHIRKITHTSVQTNLLVQALENVQNQLAFCDSVIDGNPAFSEPVNQACSLAVNQQMQFTEMLAQHNNLKASQLNFEAMENRIRRAQAKAINNQYHIMHTVLLQYLQFNRLGEHILHNAQATNINIIEIETLSAKALSGHLVILDSIFQEVPLEYQENIETCRQLTRQFEEQARHRYQEQGGSDTGPASDTNKPGSGTGEPESNLDGSANNAGEPSSGNGEPGNGAGEPGDGTGEPGGNNGGPGSRIGEPGDGTGESGIGPDEPGIGAGDPGSGRGESGNSTGS